MPLDPKSKALMDMLAGPPIFSVPVSEARAAANQLAAAMPASEPVGRVEERVIPGPLGDIAARIYWPAGAAAGALPILVYFHGGGWVLCNLDTHDGVCRSLTNLAGCITVAVDYRLAPEHRFPEPLRDCLAAVRWVADNAERLGGDPARIAVAGDSAGGNLAAAVAVASRQHGGPGLVHQVLFYPALDARCDMPSCRSLSEGYMLTAAEMRWYWDTYLVSDADRENPLACPLRAGDLGGLPAATVITAEYDPLRDEGEMYAARLQEAGVPVRLRRFDGVLHGFVLVAPLIDLAQGKEALFFASDSLRQAFAQAAAPQA
ncbi:alpha/beta hydrolase [Sorangium sp. So ce315]|uniref:alpha/beta hydrolase n=1 Tax=Sorangium sp. So ce315 TaxID=3133299 RepID=UPI003F5DF6F1